MTRKVKKNELCPCGSGKKYQYCCGALKNVLPFRRRSDFAQVRQLWGMLRDFAESRELAAQRARAWDFFQRECLCGVEPTRESIQSFLDWFSLEFSLGKETVLSFFIKKMQSDLLPEQLKILETWSDTAISFYRIREIRPGRGLLVEDILRGGITEILNKSVSSGIRPDSLIMTRLIPVGNSYDYFGALFIIPSFYEEELKKIFSREIRSWSKRKKTPPFGDPLWKSFLLRRGHFLLSFLHSLYLKSPSEDNEDRTSSEEIDSLVAITIFYLNDRDEAVRRLQKAPFLRLVQKKETLKSINTYTWEWIEKPAYREKHMGNFLLVEDRLLLHSFKQDDLSEGKEKVLSSLEGLIISQEDNFLELSLQNIYPGTISPEEDHALQENFLHHYCRAWIHSPLPGFQGETPFQLRKKKNGEAILERVLLAMEEKQDNQGGETAINLDLDLLREKLLLCGELSQWKAQEWNWEEPVYREIALLVEKIAEPMELTPQQLASTFQLWHDFVAQEKPVIRKPRAWAGALAYLISDLDYEGFSQKEIAGFFDISGGSISAISGRIRHSLDLEDKAAFYRTRKNLD